MSRPNIILIMTDQHRWDCLGCAEHPDLHTPNLDAIAALGVRFDRAWCPFPLCAPARASLLTGRYPSHHGVCDNRDPFPNHLQTLPRRLKHAGYHTQAVGKLHVNPARCDLGFDNALLAEQDGPGRYEDDYRAWLREHGRIDQTDEWDQVDRAQAPQAYWLSFGALRSNLPEPFHSTTWIGDHAVRFIQRAQAPFFLFVSFIKPHHPFDPPAPWDAMYDPRTLRLPPGFARPIPRDDMVHPKHFDLARLTEARFRRILAHYYATISQIDTQVGRIIATLTARGYSNNVIAFCADHGDYMGQHGLILKGGARPYESLLRVPLIVAGLAGQRTGQVDSAPVNLVDLLPTLVEAAGQTPPQTEAAQSLVPRLLDPAAPWRACNYAEGRNGLRAITDGQHKLIESEDPALRALYDLDADPHEFTNLYDTAEMQDTRLRLRDRLGAFL